MKIPVNSMTTKQKNRRVRDHSHKSQRGQILIIVVFAIIGLVAIVGLVVDTGLVFIGNGKLRRAVDAAALAAASEYRKDPNPSKLSAAALEFLKLNNIEDPNASVWVCNPDPAYVQFYDSTLCTTPARRRLVKVNATSTVSLAFLPVIGIRTVTLNATATSEAASLDIVLAMDVSESMTFDSPQYNLMRDPAQCNYTTSVTDLTNCHPFQDIQQAAQNFVKGLFPSNGSNEYDRVAVIPFDRNVHHATSGNYNDPLFLEDQAPYLTAGDFTGYRQKILDEIGSLRVFDASGSVSSGGPLTDGSCLNPQGNVSFPLKVPCRDYPGNGDYSCFDTNNPTIPPTPLLDLTKAVDDPARYAVFTDANNTCFTETPAGSPYQGPFFDPLNGKHYERTFLGFVCNNSPAPSFADCPGTTNTGGAFQAAGNEFTRTPGFRQESLWIVIMLTDGQADHASDTTGGGVFCPQVDGAGCQDASVKTYNSGTRHCLPSTDPVYNGLTFLYDTCMAVPPGGTGGNLVASNTSYDVDDYARDMADFVALGQQALIYTIGFGNLLGHTSDVAPNPNSPGEMLLNYAADIGDDGKIDTPNSEFNSDYFYAHDATALANIFQTISDRISTRLTH